MLHIHTRVVCNTKIMFFLLRELSAKLNISNIWWILKNLKLEIMRVGFQEHHFIGLSFGNQLGSQTWNSVSLVKEENAVQYRTAQLPCYSPAEESAEKNKESLVKPQSSVIDNVMIYFFSIYSRWKQMLFKKEKFEI